MKVGQHRFQNFRRNLGRGIVVKIDGFHWATSSTTSSGQTSSRSLISTKFLRVMLEPGRGAGAPRRHEHPVADDVDELDIAAVMFQGRRISRSMVSSIILIFWMFDSLGLADGLVSISWPDPVDDLLDRLVAIAATASRLGVIGDFFDRGKIVFPDRPFDFLIGDAEAFADDLSLHFLLGDALVIGDGLFQGLASHHGAVHLFLGGRPETRQYPDW